MYKLYEFLIKKVSNARDRAQAYKKIIVKSNEFGDAEKNTYNMKLMLRAREKKHEGAITPRLMFNSRSRQNEE